MDEEEKKDEYKGDNKYEYEEDHKAEYEERGGDKYEGKCDVDGDVGEQGEVEKEKVKGKG